MPLALSEATPRSELTTRNGLALRVRTAGPGDEDALKEFFGHVSAEDLRFRFLSGLDHVREAQLAPLTHADHKQSESYLVFDGETLVASAVLAADEAMDTAEVAIAIRSDYKGRGIGWTLLDYVARCARLKGIRTLQSIESYDNHAAIELEREMGFVARASPGDASLVIVEAQLAPV